MLKSITQSFNKLLKPELLFWFLLFLFVSGVGFHFRMQTRDIQYNKEKYNVITSDGIGYYSYLPSTFISKKNQTSENQDHYMNFDFTPGNKQNKYFVGSAILMAPFFGAAHIYTTINYNVAPEGSYSPNGYSFPYQLAICIAGVFYLMLGLYYFKKTAIGLGVKKEIVFFLIILFALGTQLMELASFESSFSHIYAFFTISFSIYSWNSFTKFPNLKLFLILIFSLSLLLLIRPTDILIVFAFPIFWIINRTSNSLSWLKEQRMAYIYALAIGLFMLSIQLIYWKLQAGTFLTWTYTDEGFDFANPEIFNTLFSYRKGLFIYTPLLIISFLIILISSLKFWIKFWLLAFFSINTYVISSWWCWWYGGSLGMRPWMDFLVIIMLILALALNQYYLKLRIPFYALAIFSIPLNIVQTYQYSWGIMHWDSMNHDKYWQIFMTTDDAFDFITYDPPEFYKDYEILDSTYIKLDETFKTTNFVEHSKIYHTLFEAPSDSLFSEDKGTYIKIKLEGKVELMRECASLICNKNIKNSTEVQQSPQRLIAYIRKAGIWKNAEVIFDLGRGNKNDADFSLFLFNSQRNHFWFKNVEITFYDYKIN